MSNEHLQKKSLFLLKILIKKIEHIYIKILLVLGARMEGI